MVYKGYNIRKIEDDEFYPKNYYLIKGCVWIFKTLKSVKGYIDTTPNIRNNDIGIMIYY